MSAETRPTVWNMVKEAVEALGSTTNVAVRDSVQEKYPGTKSNTISCQLIAGTVNHASRVHYSIRAEPRLANDPDNDLYYRPQKGQVELYDPGRHGLWEIYEKADGRLSVRQAEVEEVAPREEDAGEGHAFAAEAHLRDYLAQHLEDIEPGLQLFVDEEGNTGVEYTVPIGRIDILAVDAKDNLVVIELKVSRGPDAAAGQILRYTNWVKKRLAGERAVRGVIIAQRITDKIRYAIADNPNISAKEYEISLRLTDVPDL